MSAHKKQAWFNLGVASSAILVYLSLWPLLGPLRAMGAFGLLGFAGFGVLFYRKAKMSGRVVSDERDHQIIAKASTVAWAVIWVLLVVAFVVVLRLVGEEGSVSVRGLGMFLWWAFSVFLIVQSLATLVFYAKQ